MKKVLILCFSNLISDPRVYKQIETLLGEYKVYAAGYGELDIPGVNFIKLDEKPGGLWGKIVKLFYLKTGQYDNFYWSKEVFLCAYDKLKSYKFDLILSNDSDALPLSVRLSKESNAKLIYDAHEYTPREFESSFKWRFLWQGYRTYLCKKYLQDVDTLITVCNGIRDEYFKDFGVCAKVITNTSKYQELEPSLVHENKIKIIHHGGAIRERNLEVMIELAGLLDKRFELNLMLMESDKQYLKELRDLAKKYSNINFIPPVPMSQISNFISQFDIGIYILPENGFNCKFALPNKIFEFVQGRLMLAIGPSIEMKKILDQYKLGIVADDFSARSMADKLNQITSDEIMQFKQNSNFVAKELSSESNSKLLLGIVQNLLN